MRYLPSGRRILALAGVTVLLSACEAEDDPAPITTGELASGAAVDLTPATPEIPSYRLISADGVGGIRLGMTLGEARRAVPSASFARTSDGEGVALVEIILGPDVSIIAYADEDDSAAPIDWTKKVTNLETFSAAFQTAEGAHPGSLVADVEKSYGKTKEVMTSEVESREFITFERQPAGLAIRLDNTGDSSSPAGRRLLSIAVTRRR